MDSIKHKLGVYHPQEGERADQMHGIESYLTRLCLEVAHMQQETNTQIQALQKKMAEITATLDTLRASTSSEE